MDTQTSYPYTEQSNGNGNGLRGLIFDDDKIELMRRTIARGASEDELALFIEQCARTGLDPFARQIYSVRRKQWNSQSRSYEEAQVIQVSIDGFRLIADRTHKYAGQVGPWWCGPDGEWKEVWLSDEPPSAAKVGVLRHDFHQPLYAIALYKSYVQVNGHGEPISRWKTDPAGMLAKCAEALALRRAFPNELSGLYSTEEMGQADNPTTLVMDPVSSSMAGIAATGPATVDIETALDEVVSEERAPESEVAPEKPRKAGKSRKAGGQRPFGPEELRMNFAKAVATIEAKGLLLGPDDFSIIESALSNLATSEQDLARYLEFVTGIPYLEDMSESHIVALLRLLKPTQQDGRFIPCDEALAETEGVITWLDSRQDQNVEEE